MKTWHSKKLQKTIDNEKESVDVAAAPAEKGSIKQETAETEVARSTRLYERGCPSKKTYAKAVSQDIATSE